MNKDYKCTICGRLFIKPLPHKCIGNFRKHHLRKIFINIKENKDMTREEAIKLLRFTKVYVKDKSKEIQQKAFELGFKWLYGDKETSKMLNHLDAPFIIFYAGAMVPCCDVEYFNFDDSKEITAEEILAITIDDEPKYRPFKDAEECWREMLKHQPFGWVIDTETYAKHCIVSIIDLAVYNTESPSFPFGWDVALRRLTFADGTPFGIKEESL